MTDLRRKTIIFCSLRGAILLILLFALALLTERAEAQSPRTPVFQQTDTLLQRQLESRLREAGYGNAIRNQQLALAVVDITEPNFPRYAAFNGDKMMYAASLPKIAILFGLFKRIEEGSLPLTNWTVQKAENMIRVSSNRAATELYRLVGPEYLSELLKSPRYGLYDKSAGGGLWCGKEYSGSPAWEREPLRQLSHSATPRKVAEFYYLLDTGKLVSPELTKPMKSILANPGIYHKFVKGLLKRDRNVKMYRKSGSWQSYHSDSALISHGGKRYIAVALTDHPAGSHWLEDIIVHIDKVLVPQVGKPVVLAQNGGRGAS